MSVIHLRVNHCGIEIVDDDNAPLQERVTGLATDAAATLRQSIELIPMDDDRHLPMRMKLQSVLSVLRHVIREIDAGGA